MNSPEGRCVSVQHIFFIKMFNEVYFDVDPIVSSLAMGIGVVVVVTIIFIAIIFVVVVDADVTAIVVVVVVVVVVVATVVVTFCNLPPRTSFFRKQQTRN